MKQTADSRHSTQREALIEHLVLGEILRTLWLRGVYDVEVLKPQVDDAGYDLVIECCGVTRHVQLKSSHAGSKTASVTVHTKLASKPSGCVVWVEFNEANLELGPFRWFGGQPRSALPAISGFRVARHTKGDSTGRKAERPNLRVVRKSKFTKVDSVADLVNRLFGPLTTGSHSDQGAT